MSTTPGPPPGSPELPPELRPSEALVVREVRRGASVQLRGVDSEAADARALMDPANQALGGALRATYRLLQLTMVALVAWFLLSGFQSVRETERGLRVVMGSLREEPLEPGFAFSFPQPFGEVVRVGTTEERLDVELWPDVTAEHKGKPIHEQAKVARNSVDPLRDWSLVTGDLNIAHTVVQVRYRREDVVRWARTMTPDQENNVVRTAVMRGVVQAVAGMTIDELLKNRPDPERRPEAAWESVESQALRRAQATLDAMDTGIRITSVKLITPVPPLSLLADFARVDNAQTEGRALIDRAQQERDTRLLATAGDAAPLLLELIGLLENPGAAGRTVDPDDVMADIQAVLESTPGQLLTLRSMPERTVRVNLSGRAANRISEAQQYRSSVVSRAQADLRRFEAKLESYRANPAVMLMGDWLAAWSAFTAREQVTILAVPAGVRTLQLDLNRDPRVALEQERRLTQQEAQRAREAQARAFEQSQRENVARPTSPMQTLTTP
jgi:regulator of protease activity HflC (stomatin/prohibitin superfamily)